MKKRLTALVLTLLMVFSSISVLADSGFSDLNEFHEWAEPQIEEMTKLGIIKGYTDGSFRPDQAITKTEALVLVSRAAGYITENYDTFKTAAYTRYKDAVSQYATPYPNEICYLLYKGVLTEEDLATYISPDRANSALLRYEMAILLTKLMRAEESLNNDVSITLDYTDAGDIPYQAAAYVDYVTNASLMQGVYDPEYPDDVFFKPYSSVTRAQMAVLLYRVLDKFDTNVEYATAIGKNSNANTITYRTESGKTSFYSLTNSVNLYIDGYLTKDVTPIQTGASIAFFYVNNTLSDIEVVNTEQYRWDGVEDDYVEEVIPEEPVSGKISTIIMSDECSVIIDSVQYNLSAASAIYVNRIASTIYDLRVGQDATIHFDEGKAIMVYATTPSLTQEDTVIAEGIITKLSITDRKLYLEVENRETGAVNERALFIETGAAIFNAISGKPIDFLSLEIDDEITATGVIKDGQFYASMIIVK